MKFSRSLMPMVLAVAAAAGAIRAQAQTPAPATGPSAVAPASNSTLENTILGADASQADRDAAARQLVARNSAEARQDVTDILNATGHVEGQLAIARALARVSNPDTSLIGPIFNLIGNNTDLTDAATTALANYHDSTQSQAVLQRLTKDFAGNLAQKESTRSAAIHAMGSFVDTAAASSLIDLLQNNNPSEGIQNAACEALSDMTGLYTNDPDIQKWLQWWNLHKNQANQAFVSDLQANRAAQFPGLLAQIRQTDTAIYDTFTKTYATDSQDQKQRLLTDLLQNPAPDLRTVGVHIVFDEINKGSQPSTAVMAMFRPMIGDPATEVRFWVARALENDAASFDVLLSQLGQEADDQVKGLIAHAIAPIKDLRAVVPLENLLDDPSFQVEQDAALALAVMGPTIYSKDTELAKTVSVKLAAKLKQANGPGTDKLRSALVQAMARLQGVKTLPDQAVINAFNQSLNPRETIDVRMFAIQGIGNIGQATYADWIIPYLNDSNGSIRIEAATALGKLDVPNLYQKLVDVIHDDHADPTVHAAAWLSLQSWISIMTESQLEHCADALRDPDHPDQYLDEQLFAREALATLQEKSPPTDALAATWQQIGDLNMNVKKPADAATSYDKALKYWLSNGGHPETVARLTDNKMAALLQSGQYAAAAGLASDVMKDPNRQDDSRDVGNALATKVESLESANPDACRDLIDAIEKMNPPLPSLYAGRITEVRQRLGKPTPATPTTAATAPARP